MFTDSEVALMANQQDLRRALNQTRQELADAKGKVQSQEAMIAGLLAQVKAMREQHPNSPLLQTTSQIWQGGDNKGKPKTKLRVLYEAAHDAVLKKLGIAHPERIRGD